MSRSWAGGEAQVVCSPLVWLCAGGTHGTLLSLLAPPKLRLALWLCVSWYLQLAPSVHDHVVVVQSLSYV